MAYRVLVNKHVLKLVIFYVSVMSPNFPHINSEFLKKWATLFKTRRG